MIEAWLFADPAGPTHAKVPPARLPPSWEHARDPEDFLTRDPAYLGDDCADCTAWRALPGPRGRGTTSPRGTGSNVSFTRRHVPRVAVRLTRRRTSAAGIARPTKAGGWAHAALDWTAALRSPITAPSCGLPSWKTSPMGSARGTASRPAAASPPLTSHRARGAPRWCCGHILSPTGSFAPAGGFSRRVFDVILALLFARTIVVSGWRRFPAGLLASAAGSASSGPGSRPPAGTAATPTI